MKTDTEERNIPMRFRIKLYGTADATAVLKWAGQ